MLRRFQATKQGGTPGTEAPGSPTLCPRPLLLNEGGAVLISPSATAQTQTQPGTHEEVRKHSQSPGPAELQAGMPSGGAEDTPLNGSLCCASRLTAR